MRSGTANSGFTLLELTIVMLLVSLIMGIAVVGFASRLPAARLDAVARELSATIRHARALSQISGEKQYLTINLDTNTYGITGKGEKKVSPDIRLKVIDPAAGDITGGRHEMVFYPAGNSDGGSILLWNEKRKAQIDIDPVAGSLVIK